MVMGNNPSKNTWGDKFPVTHVNWNDAIEFCQKLTESEWENGRIPEGWVYTLPSSSEWEYACRAGTTTVFSWGNEIDPKFANYEDNNSKRSGTMEVGSFLPNPWGFFDMHGNV